MARSVLGKGLDALIPQNDSGWNEEEKFLFLAIEQIQPSSYQPRVEMDPKELKELSQSIKEKGIIQPIIVRKIREKYEIVAGHRRFYACKLLRLKELPVIVRNLSDQDTFLFAMIENLQRKDLNPIEEAQAFKRLNKEFSLNYEDIARFIGKDKTSVANSLRLLKLPGEVQEALKKGVITKTQARTILGLETPQQQKELFYEILKEDLSVREIEKKVRSVSSRKKSKSTFVTDIEERFKKELGTNVSLFNKKNNSGKIVIVYYNLNDLERITEKVLG